MTEKQVRVGIVGASNKASWAKLSHIPAIKGLSGIRLAAVATTNEKSAREAAQAFGADLWYSDPLEMICDELVDLVTIAVKVPAHRTLVLAALDAGKAVYCEAPLGSSLLEAEEMANAVSSQHTAIGLQGRHNPAVRRAAELVAAGRIGQPISARIVSPTMGFGPEVSVAHDLFNKSASGANLLTIVGGHALDMVEAVLGPIVQVDAQTEIRWPLVRLIETGAESIRETADRIRIAGLTCLGVAFTAEIEAGASRDQVRFCFEVVGSRGWLTVTGDHPYGGQAGDLVLRSDVDFDAPDAPAIAHGLPDTAINVGEVYASLVRDLNDQIHRTPGFRHALHNTRLMQAVERSAVSGKVEKVPDL